MHLWLLTLFVFELLLRLSFVGVVLLRRRPSSQTLAWILLIVGLPLVGTLLYLMMGEIKMGARRIRRVPLTAA